jgi:hypothetical protein
VARDPEKDEDQIADDSLVIMAIYHTNTAKKGQVTVASMNVGHLVELRNNIIGKLVAQKIDIICVQECDDLTFEKADILGQGQYMATLAGEICTFHRIDTFREISFLGQSEEKPIKYIATEARIANSKEVVRIANLHFHYSVADKAHAIARLHELTSWGPIALIGDFNKFVSKLRGTHNAAPHLDNHRAYEFKNSDEAGEPCAILASGPAVCTWDYVKRTAKQRQHSEHHVLIGIIQSNPAFDAYGGGDGDDREQTDSPPACSTPGAGGAAEPPLVPGPNVSDMVADAVGIQHELQLLAAASSQKLLKAERQAKRTAEARDKSFVDYLVDTPAADYSTVFDDKEVDSEGDEETEPKQKTVGQMQRLVQKRIVSINKREQLIRAIVKLANSGRVTVKYGLKVAGSVFGAGASDSSAAVPAPPVTVNNEVIDLESLIKGLLEPDSGLSHRGLPHSEIGVFGG